MTYFIVKSLISGVLIALISEIARRSPGFAALVASVPLVSVLAVIWLWRDTGDAVRVADHMQATIWFVLPSLPMFVLVPLLLRSGVGFWIALAAGCGLTVLLYWGLVQIAGSLGIKL
jgi:hypothetical protein